MMRISRRRFIGVASGAIAIGLGGIRAPRARAEAALFQWPSRTITLEPDHDQQKPPVVTAVRIHRDARLLATAGDDHIVRVFSISDGKQVQRLVRHTDWVRAVDYSSDGRWLASAGNDRRVVIWNAATGELERELPRHVNALAVVHFSHDGQRLAAAGFGEKLNLYDVEQGKLAREFIAPCSDMRAVAFAPDDQLLAAGGRCGTIRIFPLNSTDKPRDLTAHRGRIRALAFSPDGNFLASTGEDRTIHVAPVRTGTPGFRLEVRPVKYLALAFYGPHHLAVAGSDNLIRLWDLQQRRELGFLSGHTGSVAALDCQGKMLVSAGYDTTVRIWTIDDRLADDAAGDSRRVGVKPDVKTEPIRKK